MDEETFWKTTLKVVVLSKGKTPPEFEDLGQVHYAITAGECCGKWTESHRAISSKTAAKALVEMGSEPGFLGLEE